MIYHCRSVTPGRSGPGGRRHALHVLSGVGRGRDSQRRTVGQGGRRRSREARGRCRLPELASRLFKIGIPVMGHIGLTPQCCTPWGGFKVQAARRPRPRSSSTTRAALEQAGCYALVLEGIPQELAQEITAALLIPTIGIGAGVHCDGQVLVVYDLLGMNEGSVPSSSSATTTRRTHSYCGRAVHHRRCATSSFPTTTQLLQGRAASGVGDALWLGARRRRRLRREGSRRQRRRVHSLPFPRKK